MDATAAEEFQSFAYARTAALTRAAYLLTGDHHLAEDLVQSALFKTAKAWDRITGDPEPYCRRVMYHENVSWWRHRRHVTEVPAERAPERSEPTGDVDRALMLHDALQRLTPKQRTVLVLRFYEDLPESRVAAEMGVRLGTVKSQTRHALARLRALAPELVELDGVTIDE